MVAIPICHELEFPGVTLYSRPSESPSYRVRGNAEHGHFFFFYFTRWAGEIPSLYDHKEVLLITTESRAKSSLLPQLKSIPHTHIISHKNILFFPIHESSEQKSNSIEKTILNQFYLFFDNLYTYKHTLNAWNCVKRTYLYRQILSQLDAIVSIFYTQRNSDTERDYATCPGPELVIGKAKIKCKVLHA